MPDAPTPKENEAPNAAKAPAASGAAESRDELAFDLDLTAEGRALIGTDPPAQAAGVLPEAPATPAPATAPSIAPATGDAAPPTAVAPIANAGRPATPPPGPERSPRTLRRRVLAASLACGLATLAVMLTIHGRDAGQPAPAVDLPQADAPPPGPAEVGAGSAPAAAGPARPQLSPNPTVRPIQAPAAWPPAQLAPLTAGRVQQLDCASLRAGLHAGKVAPGLAAWAQFRLAWACSDAAAAPPANAPAPPAGRHWTADAMLGAAGRAGQALLRGDTLAPVRGRAGAFLRTPQGRLVQALAEARPAIPAARRGAAADRLRLARSLGGDGAYLAAELSAAQSPAAAERVFGEQIACGDALALTRASHALVAAEAWPTLLHALARRDAELAPNALPRLLVQTSPVHRRWLLELATRYHVVRGALPEAHEVARMHLAVAPHDPEVRAQADALAGLLGVQAPTAPATAPPTPRYPGDVPLTGPLPADWRLARPELTAAARAAWHRADDANDEFVPPAESQAAAVLLWRGPVPQDPVPLALAWLGALATTAATTPSDEHAPTAKDDHALRLLQAWADARPHDDRPLARLAAVGRANNDFAAVVRASEALTLRHPQEPNVVLALASALVDAGQAPRATNLLRALEPNLSAAVRPQLLVLQARAVGGQDPLQARVLLTEANRLRPDPDNEVLLADLLEAHGQLDEAILALGRAAAKRPTDAALALRRAELLGRQGAAVQARQVLQELVERVPESLPAQQMLATLAQRQGDLAAAAACLKVAAALPGAGARPLLQLGRMQLLEMGQLEAGLATLRQAVERGPELAEVYYLLGLALRDAGDDAGMRRSWHTYLTLAPHGPYAAEVHQGLRR